MKNIFLWYIRLNNARQRLREKRVDLITTEMGDKVIGSNGDPYFVQQAGLLIGRMEFVRHFNSDGWKLIDTLIFRAGKCPTLFP